MSLKVIGAGLPRTGTTSLKIALEKLLGGRCYHMSEVFQHPEHAPFWRAAAEGGSVNWDDLFSGYVAALDTPACLFWPELMQAYPQALVLLSVRDVQSWLESCRHSIFKRPRPPATSQAGSQSCAEPDEWRAMMNAVIRARMPFKPPASRDAVIQGYEQHNDAVRAAVPARRLLVWQPQDGWAPLCAALNVPLPDEPFPHTNTRKMWRFRSMLNHIAGRRLTAKALHFLAARHIRPR
jgi:hypothetical protein